MTAWTGLDAFLATGGYGFYVWGAFGVTAVVIAGELLALRRRRQALRRLAFGDAVRPDGANVPDEVAAKTHDADARDDAFANPPPFAGAVRVEYREGTA